MSSLVFDSLLAPPCLHANLFDVGDLAETRTTSTL
jgi:hypothetical protein